MSFKKWKRGWNRFLAMFLCLVMVLSMMPSVTIYAEESEDWEETHCPGCHRSYDECDFVGDNCGYCGDCICNGDSGIYHCVYCKTCDVSEFCEACADDAIGDWVICNDCAIEHGYHCPGCGQCHLDEYWCEECNFCLDCVDNGIATPHCIVCKGCNVDICPECSDEHATEMFICLQCCESEGFHCSECGGCFTAGNYIPCEERPDYCWECCIADNYHCTECEEHIVAPCEVNEDAEHCYDCAYDTYIRCISCGEYYCGLCDYGPEFNRDDSICETCIDEKKLQCPICGTIDLNLEWCEGGGEHCIDCCVIWLCDGCGECTEGKELEVCDSCGLCVECCMEASESGGCSTGEVCVESSEWEGHFCAICNICACEAEMCEYCGLCEDCCADNSECSGGMCTEDPDYEEHFCEECGSCFHDVTPCDYCISADLILCEDCCRLNSEAAGCIHGICMNSWEWDEHRCNHENCYKECSECQQAGAEAPQQHTHNYNGQGICKICGAKKDGRPVITYQSGDVRVRLPETGKEFDPVTWPKVSFIVRAKGENLHYEWHIVGVGAVGDGEYKTAGSETANLTQWVPEDGCNGFYVWKCRVYNEKGETWSEPMKLMQSHAYSEWIADPNNQAQHYHLCAGCQERQEEAHVFSGWSMIKEATQSEGGKAQRKCLYCGFEDVKNLPKLSAHEHQWETAVDRDNHAFHVTSCKVCLQKENAEVHDYGDWTITKYPSEGVAGSRSCVCNTCGYRRTEVIPALTHKHFGHYSTDKKTGETVFLSEYKTDYTFSCIKNDGTENPDFHYKVCRCGFKTKDSLADHVWYNPYDPDGVSPYTNSFIRDWETDEVYKICKDCGYKEYSDIPGHECYMLHGDALYFNTRGEQIQWAKAGDTVIAAPPTAIASKFFKHWESYGEYDHTFRSEFNAMSLTQDQENSKNLTFRMPNQPVLLLCIWETPQEYYLNANCPHEIFDERTQRMVSTLEVLAEGYEPTCETPGRTRSLFCHLCRANVESASVIPALGHNYQIMENTVLPATCVAMGYTGDQKCTRCQKILQGERTVRLGHEYSTELEIVRYPDCIHSGFYGYRCTREGCDNYVKDKLISATGHLHHRYEKDDKYHYEYCNDCDTYVTGSKQYHDWKLTVIRGGVEYRVCSVCGYSKSMEGENKLALVRYGASYNDIRLTNGTAVTEFYAVGETITLPDPADFEFTVPEGMIFQYWENDDSGKNRYLSGEEYTIQAGETCFWMVCSHELQNVDAKINVKAQFPTPGVKYSDLGMSFNNGGDYTYYINEVRYIEAETGKELTSDDRFEFGKAYYARIRARQKKDSEFLVPTQESVKQMQVTLYQDSSAGLTSNTILTGQAFHVTEDGYVDLYFGLNPQNAMELNTKSPITVQVPGGNVVTYPLKDVAIGFNEWEEYVYSLDAEVVFVDPTNAYLYAGNTILMDEHLEASIDGGQTWYHLSKLTNTGFGGLYPDTEYAVQLRRTDFGSVLNPYGKPPVVFCEKSFKTPAIQKDFLYEGAWPVPDGLFESSLNDHVFQVTDAAVTSEYVDGNRPKLVFEVKSNKLATMADVNAYVVMMKRTAGQTDKVVGGGPAEMDESGKYIFEIPKNMDCNYACAFLMGYESNGMGEPCNIWYTKMHQTTTFGKTSIKVIGLTKTKEWQTDWYCLNLGSDYETLMGEAVPANKKLRGWYCLEDAHEYLLGSTEIFMIEGKGSVTVFPTWDEADGCLNRHAMLFNIVHEEGQKARKNEEYLSGTVNGIQLNTVHLTTAQELGIAFMAMSGYSLDSFQDIALLEHDMNDILSGYNGWYYKNVPFNGQFVKGEKYTLKLYLSANEGYSFHAGTGTNLVWYDEDGKENYLRCVIVPGSNNQIMMAELTMTAKTAAANMQTITSASVTMAEMPKLGDSIFVPTLTSNANGKFEVVADGDLLPGWFEDDPTNEYLWYPGGSGLIYNGAETFVAGKNYYVVLTLTANDGYKFPEISSNKDLAAFLSLNMGKKGVAVKTEGGAENPNFELALNGMPTEKEIIVVVNWKAEGLDTSSPVLLGAEAKADGITFTWKANAGIFKYAIFRKEAGGKYAKLAETTGSGDESVMAAAGSTCTYVDKTAAAGKTYVYTARGMDENGKYKTSYDASGVTVKMTTTEVLDKTSPVLGSAVAGANGVTFTWKANSGVYKYAVFRKEAGGKWTKVAETTGSGTEGVKAAAGTTCSYVDGSAVSGKTYLYTVRGMDESGKFVTSYDANGICCTK